MTKPGKEKEFMRERPKAAEFAGSETADLVADEVRSEEDIFNGVFRIPAGGRMVTVQEMKAGASFEFRKKIGEILSPYIKTLYEAKQEEWARLLLPTLFSQGIDDLADLVFVYDPTLDEEAIRLVQTDLERIEAAGIMIEVVLPLVEGLVKTAVKVIARVKKKT